MAIPYCFYPRCSTFLPKQDRKDWDWVGIANLSRDGSELKLAFWWIMRCSTSVLANSPKSWNGRNRNFEALGLEIAFYAWLRRGTLHPDRKVEHLSSYIQPLSKSTVTPLMPPSIGADRASIFNSRSSNRSSPVVSVNRRSADGVRISTSAGDLLRSSHMITAWSHDGDQYW